LIFLDVRQSQNHVHRRENPDGSVYVGIVWPGKVFFRISLWRARANGGADSTKTLSAMGVAGFWNDMDEPSLFERADKTMPLDTRHRLDDGTSFDHRAIHNVFGMQNARATYEGLRKLQPDERPFVLTRAAYSGTQRYAATWTGDNSSTWNHLKMSTPMLLSMGISGYPLVGDDIGELCRLATGRSVDALVRSWSSEIRFTATIPPREPLDQEPWAHGPEHEAIRRKYIELRYELMPYCIYRNRRNVPYRPASHCGQCFSNIPQASDFYGDNRDFLFGRDFFVAPVTTDMVDAEEIYLPPGEMVRLLDEREAVEQGKVYFAASPR